MPKPQRRTRPSSPCLKGRGLLARGDDLIAREREWVVCAPTEPEHRNSIVTLEFDQPQEIARELVARNIITDSQLGLLRISPYFYNTIEGNALVIDAVAEILGSRRNEK